MSEKINEINILDLTSEIWKNKITLIITLIVFITSGYIYYKVTPKTVIVTYDIHPILQREVADYNLINNTYDLNNVSNFDEITSDTLLNKFLEQIVSYDEIIGAIIKYKLVDKNNYSDEDDWKTAIEEKVSNFKVKKIQRSEDNKKSLQYDQLIFNSNNDEISKFNVKNMFDYILENSNENVRINILNDYKRQLATHQYNNEKRIFKLNQEIDNLRADFFEINNNKIIYLEEQYEIAKSLDIKMISHLSNHIFKDTNKDSNEFNNSSAFSDLSEFYSIGKDRFNLIDKVPSHYYLLGYEAINQELNILKARKDANAFVPEIGRKESKIRLIKSDTTVEDTSVLLEKSPLKDSKTFKSIRINTNYFLDKKYFSQLYQIMFISLVFGLISGVIIIFSRSFNKK